MILLRFISTEKSISCVHGENGELKLLYDFPNLSPFTRLIVISFEIQEPEEE